MQYLFFWDIGFLHVVVWETLIHKSISSSQHILHRYCCHVLLLCVQPFAIICFCPTWFKVCCLRDTASQCVVWETLFSVIHQHCFFGGHMTISADGTLFTNLVECLEQCKAHLGTTHNLDMDDWPLEICVSTKTNADLTMGELLQGRMVIVMCSTLGTWSPRFPQFVANQCIVIYVKNCTRKIPTDSRPVNSNVEIHKRSKMSRLIFVLVNDFGRLCNIWKGSIVFPVFWLVLVSLVVSIRLCHWCLSKVRRASLISSTFILSLRLLAFTTQHFTSRASPLFLHMILTS